MSYAESKQLKLGSDPEDGSDPDEPTGFARFDKDLPHPHGLYQHELQHPTQGFGGSGRSNTSPTQKGVPVTNDFSKIRPNSRYSRGSEVPPNDDNSPSEEETIETGSNQSKEVYLRALAAEGLRVGRQMSRSLLKFNSRSTNGGKSPKQRHRQVQEERAHTHTQGAAREASAVETLLRVFPTKTRAEIDAILQKTDGEVVRALDLLLNQATHRPEPFVSDQATTERRNTHAYDTGRRPSGSEGRDSDGAMDLALDPRAKAMQHVMSPFLAPKQQPQQLCPGMTGHSDISSRQALMHNVFGAENPPAFSFFGQIGRAHV